MKRFVDVSLVGIKVLNENTKIFDEDAHVLIYSETSNVSLTIQDNTFDVFKETLFFIENNQNISISLDDNKCYLIKIKGEVVNEIFSINSLEKKNVFIPVSTDMKKILNELIEKQMKDYNNLYSIGLLYQLLYYINLYINMNNKEEKKSYYVELAKTFIELHYFKDISVSDIASACRLNPNYLAVIFHKEMGITPKGYLIKIRMEQAKKLLLTNKYKIQEVSKKVGYKHQLYFSQTFKKYYGLSPTYYLQQSKI